MKLESFRTFEVETANDPDNGWDYLRVSLIANVGGTDYVVLRYGLREAHRKLASRLGQAWMRCAFYKTLIMKQDVNGKPYVTSNSIRDFAPLGRTLNANLRRLGF
jgi:hypothetical protein